MSDITRSTHYTFEYDYPECGDAAVEIEREHRLVRVARWLVTKEPTARWWLLLLYATLILNGLAGLAQAVSS